MKKKKYHLPLSIILLNLILAIFPILAGILISNQILLVVTDDIAENNIKIMRRVVDSYENNYSSLGRRIFPLQENYAIIRLKNLADPYREEHVIRLLDCMEDFNLVMSNQEEDHIIDSFLYFCTNDVVITPLNIFRSREFFSSQFSLGDPNGAGWPEELRNSRYSMAILPQQKIRYQGKEIQGNLFIHSLFHNNYNTEVYFVALLDREFFVNQLAGFDFVKQGDFSVFREGNLLFQEGARAVQRAIPDQVSGWSGREGYRFIDDGDADKLVTHVYSQQRKTSFLVEQNSIDELSAVLGNIRRSLAIGGMLYVLIASFFTFLLTRRNRVTLMSSHTIARHQLIGGLFSGTIIAREELDKAWSDLKLPRDNRLWGMVHISLKPYEDTSTTSEILLQHGMDIYGLRDRLTEQLSSLFTLHVPSSQRLRFYLVHAFTADDEGEAASQWREDLDRLYRFFVEENGIDIFIGYGSLQADPMQLYVSHAQARQAVNLLVKEQKPGIRGYIEENGSRTTPKLPDNIFNTLEAYMFQGNIQGIEHVFDSLRSILFDPQLTFVIRQFLITRIYGSVIEITERTSREHPLSWSPEFFSKIKEQEGIGELFIRLRDKTKAAAREINSHKKSHNTELLDRILDGMMQRLSDPYLNAAAIAEAVGITESYLYQFFKEQTGTTFSAYLEERRMDMARRLLLESEMPVREVAEKVGYGSSNTFGRAFKRNFGSTAGNFRSLSRDNR